jgi:hypothetical protein
MEDFDWLFTNFTRLHEMFDQIKKERDFSTAF